MSSKRQYNGRFKAQVALDAIKSEKTIGEIASHYSIHPSQIHKWKKHVIDELPNMFTDNGKNIQQDNEKIQSELYEQIGKLKVELDWMKKKLVLPTDQKRGLVELSHPEIPIYRQCELLGLSRSSFYYKPRGVSEYNHLLMGMIDEEYTAHPFYGIMSFRRPTGETDDGVSSGARLSGQPQASWAFNAPHGYKSYLSKAQIEQRCGQL
jgi:putative transposase